MPNKNPRVNVVLDKELYHTVYNLAQNRGISMSLLMRDLVKEAIEIQEDQTLAAIAETREQSFDPNTALSHEEVWG
ncbi:MAG: ribbon-helix-helix domain-containing protein [Desulfohalobiaceae bacterium]|nr:ribbon-helix-helix domain-containing protein [Desulfohalobiaceae bacterium]